MVHPSDRVIRLKVDRFETSQEASMGELKSSTEEILVHLVRPGVGVQDYHLAEGATLADLLRQSGTSTTDQAVFVDGMAPEERLPLSMGVVVTIVPRPGSADGDEPWRAAVPAFRDEALFQEYSEALKARRRGGDPGEGQAG
jgi:sulfur carrier protein ThiS